MAWRLAKSLVKLREQVNAAHPNRSTASDGSIGDPRHAARASDHNPNSAGVVTAVDITVDRANGVNGYELSRSLAQDGRAKYIIYNSEIFRSYKPQLGWAKYTGSNAHKQHVHISVLASKADDESPWFEQAPVTASRITLRRGSKGQAVRLLQEKLGLPIDGVFGSGVEKAVKAFQTKHGLTADAVIGPASWRALDLK